VLVVTNSNNGGAGSLRQTISSANPGDTIVFDPSVRGVIVLDTPGSPGLGGELLIDKDLLINGPGANVLRIRQERNTEDRVFHISAGHVSISGLSISGGDDTSSNFGGGGVLIDSGATLSLGNCMITGNTSSNSGGAGGIQNFGTLNLSNSAVERNDGDVGGLASSGTLTLTNSTFSDNAANITGGIEVDAGTASILNCTIAHNGDADGNSNVGGMKIVSGSTVSLKNSIVADDATSTQSQDVQGNIVSLGNNLVRNPAEGTGFIASDLLNVNPQLGGYANNGGTTYTYSLRAGSPAINAGNNAGAPATDQRGVARPQGGLVDIGAYESGVRPAVFGKIVFVSIRDGNSEIYSIRADGTGQTRLTNNPARDDSPRWSPDGGKIVFVSDRDGLLEIYTMNADGSNQQRLTTNSVPDEDPAWSPDGNQIAFARGGHILLMDSNGENERQVTSDSFSGEQGHPSWSPDGSQIVFHNSSFSEPDQIYTVNSACVNCTSRQWLTRDLPPDSFGPVWSPDGNTIVCSNDQSSDHSHPDSFLISPFPSLDFVLRQRPVLTTGNTTPFSPAWSPDGSKLVYSTNFGDLFIVDADGTNPTLLVDHTVSGFSSLPDWAGSQ
jgi:hypothetical protein